MEEGWGSDKRRGHGGALRTTPSVRAAGAASWVSSPSSVHWPSLCAAKFDQNALLISLSGYGGKFLTIKCACATKYFFLLSFTLKCCALQVSSRGANVESQFLQLANLIKSDVSHRKHGVSISIIQNCSLIKYAFIKHPLSASYLCYNKSCITLEYPANHFRKKMH